MDTGGNHYEDKILSLYSFYLLLLKSPEHGLDINMGKKSKLSLKI